MKFFVRSRSADPVDPVEAETLFRAAVAADDSPSESYCIFAPARHALDLARIGLATMLKRGGDEMLVEAANLLDAVLDHDNIPSNQPQQLRRPNSEARALRADIILRQQAPGALAEALELVEAIPAADLEGIEGSNCAYMLGKVYKTLDEETPNDEHARRAWEHINAAMGEGHPLAAFDMGQMAERGRGTPVHMLTAYTGYVMATMRTFPDMRAVARLEEVIAAGPPLPMELVVAVARARQYSVQAERDGTAHRRRHEPESDARGLLGVDGRIPTTGRSGRADCGRCSKRTGRRPRGNLCRVGHGSAAADGPGRRGLDPGIPPCKH